jgi:DNA helicase HerA-like ATPase
MATSVISKIAKVDLFARDGATGQYKAGEFVGRPFHLDYDKAYLLVADAWKNKVGGVPQGSFLLAYYENEDEIQESLLLRVLQPAALPTDSDVISSMVEYYKDNLRTTGSKSQLDSFTQYEFSFSGLECRVLGTFYRDQGGETRFGADVENFYSSHHYTVVKPSPQALEYVVNFREGDVVGRPTDIRIGRVRYSSAIRFQGRNETVPVYVSPQDFLGKRTALFGMTRTGKSNTVKKIVEASAVMSQKAKASLVKAKTGAADENLEPFTETGVPKFPVGQIIFDINGEYANANLQDQGTAVFELYPKDVTRYSVLEKPGFEVMKVNFYKDIEAGFELVRGHLGQDTTIYIRSFSAVDLSEPEDEGDQSARTRYQRKVAAYLCCLHEAGFAAPPDFKVRFSGNKQLNEMVKKDGSIDPSKGITLQEATTWFSKVWDLHATSTYFSEYEHDNGHPWADEDLKAILIVLTRKPAPGGGANVAGFRKLRDLKGLHSDLVEEPFEDKIVDGLRGGRIVIVDLSQGDPAIQRLFSERICRRVFMDSMSRFVENKPNNFIQFYFEEAHNLFPKREDRDLSQIYNRLAKEGAKLNIGLIYATQEVSSISANILKNTQNWFIAHLNNDEETKEIKKYYDFGDFADSLIRFSASTDKGFVRMKTYSNPFVVPVQVDRFLAEKQGE